MPRPDFEPESSFKTQVRSSYQVRHHATQRTKMYSQKLSKGKASKRLVQSHNINKFHVFALAKLFNVDPSAVAGLTAEFLSAENPPKKIRLAKIAAKNVQPNISQEKTRIMTDIMITSDILIIRLIKLCSVDVV